jgi:integrase
MSSKSSQQEKLRGARGVYKRGSVWVAVVEYPRDPKTGQRKRVWLPGFRTRKEAEEARDRARADVRNGIDIAPEKLTVKGLLERWLADAKTRIATKTHQEYVGISERYLVPDLGGIALAKLRPLHVQEVYGTLLACGLSPTTVRHAHGLLKSVLSWAVRMQIIARNVAEAVDAPTRARSEANALNDDEVLRILDAAHGTRWETAITLALATGMRRGEIGALKWDAVDLDAKTLTVRASLSQTTGGVVLKSTKTGRVRTIPLTPLAFDALRERRRAYLAERLAAGASYDDQGFVVADPFGRPPTPFALTDAFREIAKKADVKKRLHDTRHTFATMLIGEKVDPQTVATLLGHVNANVTLAIYSHQIAGHKEAAVAKVGDRLQNVLDRRKKA